MRVACAILLTAVEQQVGVGTPALLHGEVIDRAGADPRGPEARPSLGRRGRIVLGRLRRPFGEERRALIAQGTLQRHADANPAVVIELGVRQPGESASDRGQRAGLCVTRQTLLGRHVRRLGAEALRAQPGRDQCQRLVEEGRCPVGVDFGQALDVEIRKPLVRPGIGPAGIGMLGIGHELLPEAEDFQRRAPDPGEWLGRPIDEEPLRCLADPERRGVAQPFAGQAFDAQRQLAILGDVDVERGDRAADDPDAAAGPGRPGRDLDLGRGAAAHACSSCG
ncbi:MAG: hypothetical protein KatS3mg118_3357 [Paracoccaceae bacterium]|nr:MAG: hypothetical protein KatS3mg118_3357 [Paracoccaceae bacterium]